MNNIIQSEWEHYVSFRLQSVRRKKRMQREDFEKKLLSLHKERQQLYLQQRKFGWIDLHPPVLRGWKRFFVLREDIARSKNGAFFECLLQKINTVQYSNRKDFKVKKRKAGKKIYVLKEQQLLLLCQRRFNELNFNEKEGQFFEERYVKEKWRKELIKVYVFTEPWRFVLRIRPNIITKVRVEDITIEKRISEIDDFIDRNGLTGKLDHLLRGDTYWHWHDIEEDVFKNKPLTVILDEIKLSE